VVDTEVSVALWLFGDFDPDEISRLLELTPSSQGQPRTGRWPRGASWTLSSDDHVKSDLFEPHIEWVLASVEPRATALAKLISGGAEAHINCDWSSVGSSGGPVISVESMSRLTALGLPLVISFYAIRDESDESDAAPC